MTLADTLKTLDLPNSLLPELEPEWEKSQRSKPELIPELEPETIAASADYAQLDKSLLPRLLKTAEVIKKNPAFTALFFHAYYRLFCCREVRDFRNWPELDTILQENSGLFYLLVSLGMVKLTRDKHRQMGIPDSITRQTVLQIGCYNLNHMAAHEGQPGILRQQMYWFHWYTDGVIFRIGRFEYRLKTLDEIGTVYRHKQTGAKLLLAADGRKFDRNGFVDGINDQFDRKGWTATLNESSQAVMGTPISPFGHAVDQTVSLPLDQWTRFLGTGDEILDLHIPSGGGMNPDACKNSFTEAVSFFQDHFPDKTPKAFFCNSWIFNPLFAEKMPESNLAVFMKQQYLFPVPSTGKDGFFFIFCRDYDDLSQAPRKTRLQKIMLETLESGKPLRSGGMLFFTEDIQHFGTLYYQTLWESSEYQHQITKNH